MNIQTVKDTLESISQAGYSINDICNLEQMERFGNAWRTIADHAKMLMTVPVRNEVLDLARDILRMYRPEASGFTEMYIIRDEYEDRVRANQKFEELRTYLRVKAELLTDAADEGEVRPLAVRRALVELESWLLSNYEAELASMIRRLLNKTDIDTEALEEILSALDRRAVGSSQLLPLVANLVRARVSSSIV